METILKREIIVSKIWCRSIGVVFFAVITMLGAYVRIPLPFTPVPLTLQTMCVLLSGAFLGGKFGLISQLIYLFWGFSGMPVFTGASFGLSHIWGPTGGYLLGFAAASLFIGNFLHNNKNNPAVIFGLFCLADCIILACGTLWIKFLFGVNLQTAVLLGFVPFIIGDVIKAGAATLAYLKLRDRAEKIF